MVIRRAKLSDLDEIAHIESVCFPPDQAAGKTAFESRLQTYPRHFLLMCDEYGKVVSAVSKLHNEKGEWQMVFGLCTLPDYRQRGFAQTLLKEFIRTAKSEGRKGVVLTCKQELIKYYEKFGFVSEGVTENSVIGGVQWYQMRRVL